MLHQLPNGLEITITRRTRSRRISIRIHENGSIKVCAPIWAGTKVITAFIEQKSTWIIAHHKRITENTQPAISIPAKTIPQLRREALRRIKERFFLMGPTFMKQPRALLVRRYKRRWGCCARDGRLTFNIVLGLLPDHLIDYVLAHELCHLEEFNHSNRFYFLLSQHIADYRKRRKELHGIRYVFTSR